MKSRLIALGLGLSMAVPAAGAQTEPAAAEAPRKLELSKEARAAMIALQEAVNANDVANIPARIAAAQAVAKSADDHYFIARQRLKAALAAKNEAEIGAAAEAVLATGRADSFELPKLHVIIGKVNYNAKQYAKAEAAFERALALEPSNGDTIALLAESRKHQGRTGDALELLKREIQAHTTAGRKPPEILYKRALALAYNSKSPEALELSRQWVAAYPSPANWSDALGVYRNLVRPDQATTLNVLRLARLVGALDGEADYHNYAFAAVDTGAAGEAKSLIDEGLGAKKINPASPLIKEITAALKTKATTADRESLPERTQVALGDPMARVALRVGGVHYGYGDYARAAELYRAALAKNGADADLINLHLGMALARAGDKAGATAALSAVKGPRAELAKYWLIYVATLG